MPATSATPTDEKRQHALGISTAQVAGSALAAVSAAVMASWLGVAGTLIGAALASVVGTVGTATYTYSLQQGRAVVRRTAPPRRGFDEPAAAVTTVAGGVPLATGGSGLRADEADASTAAATEYRLPWWRALPWPRIALAAATVMVAAVGVLTLIEGVAGQPVSSLTTGRDSSGTTLGHVTSDDSDADVHDTEPTETPPTDDATDPGTTTSPSPTPDDEATPTPEPTTSPTDEPTDPATEQPPADGLADPGTTTDGSVPPDLDAVG